jgi:hypothetical protein
MHDLYTGPDLVNAESDVFIDGSKVIDIDTPVLQGVVIMAMQVRNNGYRPGRNRPWTALPAARLGGMAVQPGPETRVMTGDITCDRNGHNQH